ncbi:metallophosphoesterase family protein [Neobacillus niacini]|uniref:metallophosphoesterase family protein n=1 Tax=Neobacillus niacini TaxID=86668 RepID=UPI00204182CF|nr:DNA repair exonuclease [Neobacillus niacini]MCM3690292.1 DNA repair exonuclease [Neobacillus niacini]
MKQISFIHAADLHLDSPMVGLKNLPANILSRVRESTFTALGNLTSAAIDNNVDFVILAGDLYDGEDRSLRAQSRFRNEMQKLSQKGIPVYVIHGNHDHLNGSWVHLDMPSNVHFFSSDVEMKIFHTKRGEKVHLYGFSYLKRHILDKRIDDYHKQEPADFHIGILHGNEGGGTEHDNYAPFTIKDLQEKDFDYWALGHIHKRTILSETPPIIYPGNLQGRNKKEGGMKGCYCITLNELEARKEFIVTSDVVWEEVYIDAASAQSFQDIFHLCQITIERFRKAGIGTLLTLNLKNVQLDDYHEKRVLDTELLELLLDYENEEESFVWIVHLSLEDNQQLDRKNLMKEADFYSELFATIDDYQNPEAAIAPLYEHQMGRKYLKGLTESEQKELLEKAEKLLISLLYQ